MPTLENFDARSLALDFSPLLLIKQALDKNKAREFNERKLALQEEVQRGNLDISQAELILREEAGELAERKFEAEQTNQQSIQEALSQLINPSQEQPIAPDQGIEAGTVQPQIPQRRTAPPVDIAKREALFLKLAGIKGGPAILKTVEPIFKSRDIRAKLALQKEIDDKQRFALSLSRIKTREGQDREIDREIAKQARTGEVDPFLTELRNMTDANRESELFLDIAQGDVLKDLAKNELVPPKAQEPFTLSPGQVRFDPSGKEIASVATAPPKPEQETTLIRTLRSIGINPLSDEGKKIVKESIIKPGVKIDLNQGLDFKIPNGFELLDKNDPTKGVKPIPGGPKDSLSGETAGKAQMLRTARKAAEGIRALIFEKDGTLNRTNLFNASFGTPGTAGRELRNKMEFGIQGITRTETGAAMPDSEVDNTRERFTPTIFDSAKTAKLKIDMFFDFLDGTLDLIDPTGRLNEDGIRTGKLNNAKFDAELRRRGGEPAPENKPAQPQRNIVVDF